MEVTFQQSAFWCPCCVLGVHDYPPPAGSWRLEGRQGAGGRNKDRKQDNVLKTHVSKLGSETRIARLVAFHLKVNH